MSFGFRTQIPDLSLFLFSLSYVHACAGRFRGYKTCSGVASVPTSHPVAQSTEAGGDMLLDIINSTPNAFDDQLTSHLNG
jgi:hypothetical protein